MSTTSRTLASLIAPTQLAALLAPSAAHAANNRLAVDPSGGTTDCYTDNALEHVRNDDSDVTLEFVNEVDACVRAGGVVIDDVCGKTKPDSLNRKDNFDVHRIVTWSSASPSSGWTA